MRYNKTTIAFAACVASMLVSCSNNDEDVFQCSYPSDNVVRVSANVGDLQTRAAYTGKTITEFGISIRNANSTTYSYGNVQATKSGDDWTTASQMLWQNATQPVDIIAVAPYNSAFAGNLYDQTAYEVTVGTDQTLADDHSDFLVFRKTGFVPQDGLVNSAVPVNFSHALSQLNINITFGAEFNNTALLAADPITEIKVNGTVIMGTCDLANTTDVKASTDAATYTKSVKAASTDAFVAATGKDDNAKASYTCILVPQTVSAGNFSVSITADGKLYTWTSPSDVNLEKGMSHQLDLKVGKDNVILLSSGITTCRWTDGGNSTLETE